MISFSAYLLLVYKRHYWFFCGLVLYPELCWDCFCQNFRICYVYITSSANRYSLISSFPICIPLIFCFCFINVTAALMTTWIKSGDSVQPCLIFYSSGIAWTFSPFRMMLNVVVSNTAFIMLRYIPSSYSHSKTFITYYMVKFFICFVYTYWDTSIILVVKFIYLIYYINWLVPLNLCDKVNLAMVKDLLICGYI